MLTFLSHALTTGQILPTELRLSDTAPPISVTSAEKEFITKAEIWQRLARSAALVSHLRADLDSWDFVQGPCKDLGDMSNGKNVFVPRLKLSFLEDNSSCILCSSSEPRNLVMTSGLSLAVFQNRKFFSILPI
jgi:hypothetical protein